MKIILEEVENGYRWNSKDKISYVQIFYKKGPGRAYHFIGKRKYIEKSKPIKFKEQEIIEKEGEFYITNIEIKYCKNPMDATLRKMQDFILANDFILPKFESLETRILEKKKPNPKA